ncbi:hypothetical protein MMC07_008376 [Pseudocyphellaria aurata]|nr:hypothetical protein [Pseudocyphellaria aurata]
MYSMFIVLVLHLIASACAVNLNLTATIGRNMKSVFECWQLTKPFVIANGNGINGAAVQDLGPLVNGSYAVLPGQFNGGLHTTPTVQYVLFTSGLVHVTLPDSADEYWIQGGKNGLIFAADTAAVSKLGHITDYPGREQTTAIALPTAGGVIPAHRVLHQGACPRDEVDFAPR